MSLRIFENLDDLSVAAAEFFVKRSREAIETEGRFSVALAGGNTPKKLYELLAKEPYVGYIEWSRVLVFFGDERFVPPSDKDSNEGMARAALLDHVPIPAENIFPMYGSGTVEEQVETYEKLLYAKLGNHATLDLVLLGMGDDGHTASLFPGIPELLEDEKLVVATTSPKGVPQRISLTIPTLDAAHTLLFMVAGADKTAQLALALGNDLKKRPPSGVVAAGAQRAVWYVDKAAAGDLKED